MIPKRNYMIGVAILAICALWVPAVFAQAVPGGTLDPNQIPKYVTPLVIPPVLFDDQGGIAPLNVEVGLRQFSQQVLPTIGCNAASAAQEAAGGDPIGCVGDAFPVTTLWGYGDTNRPGTFNNPAFTFEVTKDTTTTVNWKNELVDADNNYLPHIIKDGAGQPIIDQTLHWANPPQTCADGTTRSDCRGDTDTPYTGPVPMVVHVHGAHVTPESDGYPEAWYLPAANDIPEGYATEGKFYDDINGGAPGTGSAVFSYPNDQPTTTLWYHDHGLGITRLNVYAASAGFWLIRDGQDGETGLLAGLLPGPATLVGQDPNGDPAVRGAIREIPIAIQPKSFNADGSQFYPADRAFFEGLGDGQTFIDNTGLNIEFLPNYAEEDPSDIAPAWNPEAFFNTMTVNGNTWPVLEVAPERYRFRLLNASDSRFLNLSLRKGSANSNAEIPFYQIGTEQGLLPQVVHVQTGFATPLPGDGRDACRGSNPGNSGRCVPRVPGIFAEQALLMGPAERPDVIVDFSSLEDGDEIVMVNTGPDAPFGGFPDVPADPATTGQVMKFRVNYALVPTDPTTQQPRVDPSTPAPLIGLDANPGGEPKLNLPTNPIPRNLALLEEESADICVIIDPVTGVIDQVAGSLPPDCAAGGVPFGPQAAVLGTNGSGGGEAQLWSDPIRQNPALNAIEEWDMWNWSADAHPMHLHLVKFEVVKRWSVDVGYDGVVPPDGTGIQPWETGWKDTVIAYPGEITRIKAKFDIAGLYVWHCHILSHEDNEMMVPYVVGEPGVDFADPDDKVAGLFDPPPE